MTARWLKPPFDLDGWRVDVANMAGRLRDIDVNRVAARAMRATMAAVKPDTYLVAEHAYDASRELDGDGWHGVMNYLSFTRPGVVLAAPRRRHQVPRRPAAGPPLRRTRDGRLVP